MGSNPTPAVHRAEFRIVERSSSRSDSPPELHKHVVELGASAGSLHDECDVVVTFGN